MDCTALGDRAIQSEYETVPSYRTPDSGEVGLHGRNRTCGSPYAAYQYGSAPTSLVSF